MHYAVHGNTAAEVIVNRANNGNSVRPTFNLLSTVNYASGIKTSSDPIRLA